MFCRLSGMGGVIARDLDPDKIGDDDGDRDNDREWGGDGEELRLCARVEGRDED